jgi:hypothetical protein
VQKFAAYFPKLRKILLKQQKSTTIVSQTIPLYTPEHTTFYHNNIHSTQRHRRLITCSTIAYVNSFLLCCRRRRMLMTAIDEVTSNMIWDLAAGSAAWAYAKTFSRLYGPQRHTCHHSSFFFPHASHVHSKCPPKNYESRCPYYPKFLSLQNFVAYFTK